MLLWMYSVICSWREAIPARPWIFDISVIFYKIDEKACIMYCFST